MRLSRFITRPFALATVLTLLAASPAPEPSPTKHPTPCLNDILVDMESKLDSGNAIPGQVFRFSVKRAITVEGRHYPAGTLGLGLVRAVSKAGRHDQYGFIALEPRYLLLPHGIVQQVSTDPYLPALFTSSTPNLEKAASRVPNPLPGIVMTGINFLRWGKNVTLGPGFTFYVVPIGDLMKNGSC